MKLKIVKYVVAIALAFGGRMEAQDDGRRFFPLLICSNRIYTNATAWGVTPVAVTFTFDGGREQIPIANLPSELQSRFHYSPQKAQNYLDKQAAIAVAKSKLGPAQTIRIIRILPSGHLQIETQGGIAEAYIHNLPSEILASLNEISKNQAEIAKLAAAVNNVGATPHIVGLIGSYPPRGEVERNAVAIAAGQEADARAAHLAALRKTSDALAESQSHLRSLIAEFETRDRVIARPSDFVAGITRQWEFQAVYIPVQTSLDTRP